MVRVLLRSDGAPAVTLSGQAGQSLMQLIKSEALPLQGLCGGTMDCATCHVVVAAEWTAALPPPSEDEEDMLDLIPSCVAGSRLSCQIRLGEALDGLVVTLPPGSYGAGA